MKSQNNCPQIERAQTPAERTSALPTGTDPAERHVHDKNTELTVFKKFAKAECRARGESAEAPGAAEIAAPNTNRVFLQNSPGKFREIS